MPAAAGSVGRLSWSYADGVLVLLPPSEGKSPPVRGPALDLSRLSLPELTATRAAVLQALVTVSGRPGGAAALGVPAARAPEVERNTRLRQEPTLPAGSVYTGVLYAALGLAALDPAAARRAARRLLVVSALFGALRVTDRIPAYRLAMGVSLEPLGPLAAVWRAPLAEALPPLAGRGLVVDCRSAPYAAAWSPVGELGQRWVTVRVPGVTHHAKHTRGLVARALCLLPDDPRTPQRLAGILDGFGDGPTVLHTRLTEPPRPGRPWQLDVTTST